MNLAKKPALNEETLEFALQDAQQRFNFTQDEMNKRSTYEGYGWLLHCTVRKHVINKLVLQELQALRGGKQ